MQKGEILALLRVAGLWILLNLFRIFYSEKRAVENMEILFNLGAWRNWRQRRNGKKIVDLQTQGVRRWSAGRIDPQLTKHTIAGMEFYELISAEDLPPFTAKYMLVSRMIKRGSLDFYEPPLSEQSFSEFLSGFWRDRELSKVVPADRDITHSCVSQ